MRIHREVRKLPLQITHCSCGLSAQANDCEITTAYPAPMRDIVIGYVWRSKDTSKVNLCIDEREHKVRRSSEFLCSYRASCSSLYFYVHRPVKIDCCIFGIFLNSAFTEFPQVRFYGTSCLHLFIRFIAAFRRAFTLLPFPRWALHYQQHYVCGHRKSVACEGSKSGLYCNTTHQPCVLAIRSP